MRRICIGVMAHVDAGKTTLAEGLLYVGGALRRLGRVDHGDAFLDTDAVERERGITVFAKQAVLPLGDVELTLLDTPGHVDFSSEMERTLQVLDGALLVVSGTDGVQSHTRTLWRLLQRYQVPTFVFVNKMDLAGADKERVLEELGKLDGGFVDFTAPAEERDEAAAMCGEEALEEFLETGAVSQDTLARLTGERKLFPCWFGSALKLEGVEALLSGLETGLPGKEYPRAFGARVFKISRDSQGARLTWLKVTGGALRPKELIGGGAGEERWEEKVDQLRLYSGEKFRTLEEAPAGTVCAVTGLSRTYPGQGLGAEEDGARPVLEPVLSYQLILPQGVDPHTVLPKLRQLEEEDPMLRVVWNERWKEIHLQLMGQVQLEVLRRVLSDRFGLEADFGTGGIVYRETITGPVEGVGHFEPLRHYAEVHLLLEPGERGSGVRVASACSADQLDLNWQRLVLTHLLEREHPGVLTGSPLTDVKITLVAGRAHNKHTEGGDFRQATYRAVRQGLMQAETILLEPVYDFTLEVPVDCVGRAMTDLQNMGGTVEPPENGEELVTLTGQAPVAGLRDYGQQVAAYTRGRGRLSCTAGGYAPCRSQEEVAAELGYDPERDVDNPADSVFCDHGAGVVVKWNEVREHMHVDSGLRLGEEPEEEEPAAPAGGERAYRGGSLEQDKELQAIFERTYGKVERQAFQPQKKPARTSLDEGKYHIRNQKTGPEYLLVDGYNIIFAWEELEAVARQDVAAARAMLTDILSNYQGYRKCVVILVFDAYKVKGNPGSVEKVNNIYVVYTKEAETADAYIEKATYDLQKEHRVRVATSDGLEQLIILGHGALRLSARAFKAEVEQAQGEISDLIRRHNQSGGREQNQLRSTAQVKKRAETP
ncbi:GTP-binding protein [Pseudoflavonifractor sp. AF19-9AC]|uniref:translation factor GTPase family protein n=1 Tax=Pseudoflavonifractor sp. AF19-9AC TaxID=2292244 RepID=UPI000E4E02AB|nr:TetM/TetW/TetO/TetS family tetracycline resistance ribosomal protection protein [Pseudoflavonifractor sp. AF19-9AC]RHR06717.1 GTP-binding protein [Pseudoflavonifractor sp. AF19-9AC]